MNDDQRAALVKDMRGCRSWAGQPAMYMLLQRALAHIEAEQDERIAALESELARLRQPVTSGTELVHSSYVSDTTKEIMRLKTEIERLARSEAEARAERGTMLHDGKNFTPLGEIIRRMEQERDAARAELEKAKEDAERYRWLRNSSDDAPFIVDGAGYAESWIELRGDKADAAIDAARSEK